MPVTPTTPTPAARTSASPEPSRADQDTGRLQARSTERGTSRIPVRSAGAAAVADEPSTDLRRRTVAPQIAPASPASSSGWSAAGVTPDAAPDGTLDLGNDMSTLKRVLTQHTDVGRFLPRSSDAVILGQARNHTQNLANELDAELDTSEVRNQMPDDQIAVMKAKIRKLRSLFTETGLLQRAPKMAATLAAYIPPFLVASQSVANKGSIVFAFQVGNSSKNAFQAFMLATQGTTSPQAIKEHADYRLLAPFLISSAFVKDALAVNPADRSPSTALGLGAAAAGVLVTAAKWNAPAISQLMQHAKESFSANPPNVNREVLDPIVQDFAQRALAGTRDSIAAVTQLRSDSSPNAVTNTNLASGLNNLKQIESEMAKYLGQEPSSLDNPAMAAKLGVSLIGAAMVSVIVGGFLMNESIVGASLNGGFGALSVIELVKGAMDGSVDIADQITRLASTQGQSPLIILFLFLEFATGAGAGNDAGLLNTGEFDATLAIITSVGVAFGMFGPEMVGWGGATVGDWISNRGNDSDTAPPPLNPVVIEELSSDEEVGAPAINPLYSSPT